MENGKDRRENAGKAKRDEFFEGWAREQQQGGSRRGPSASIHELHCVLLLLRGFPSEGRVAEVQLQPLQLCGRFECHRRVAHVRRGPVEQAARGEPPTIVREECQPRIRVHCSADHVAHLPRIAICPFTTSVQQSPLRRFWFQLAFLRLRPAPEYAARVRSQWLVGLVRR